VKLGIQTGLFHDTDILETLPLIRESGFETVEIWAGPQKSGEYVHFDWHDESRARLLGERLRSLGLSVHSLHAPFSDALDVSSPNEIERRFAVTEICRTMATLKSLGGQCVVVHPASNERSMHDKAAVSLSRGKASRSFRSARPGRG
jgi:Sugar phosphate isomerases/epimerases